MKTTKIHSIRVDVEGPDYFSIKERAQNIGKQFYGKLLQGNTVVVEINENELISIPQITAGGTPLLFEVTVTIELWSPDNE